MKKISIFAKKVAEMLVFHLGIWTNLYCKIIEITIDVIGLPFRNRKGCLVGKYRVVICCSIVVTPWECVWFIG